MATLSAFQLASLSNIAENLASGFAPKGELCFETGKQLQRIAETLRQAPDCRELPVPATGEGRIIEHLGCAVDYHVMMEHVTPLEFYRAVGYLSTWNMSYPHVRLYYNAKEMEITASYYNEAGELGYCIGAVFNETSRQFGFHS